MNNFLKKKQLKKRLKHSKSFYFQKDPKRSKLEIHFVSPERLSCITNEMTKFYFDKILKILTTESTLLNNSLNFQFLINLIFGTGKLMVISEFKNFKFPLLGDVSSPQNNKD